MVTQQDLQELLRLLTVGRKMPMKQAMSQIKALQAADLRSIKQIAEATSKTVESALNDAKAAKSLQSACKAARKRGDLTGPVKRSAPGDDDPGGSSTKRLRSSYADDLGPVGLMSHELEASLSLPVCTDEVNIVETVLLTNRAPLVLAFAVELLRYTMPEQPPSSRLSLAQAVVSANARTKAVSIGIDKEPSADEEGRGVGQPVVSVMGREVQVLKRGMYEWKGEEEVGEEKYGQDTQGGVVKKEEEGEGTEAKTETPEPSVAAANGWVAGPSISLKKSTFIARAIPMTDPSQKDKLIRSLLDSNPSLRTANHNAWAYRVRPPSSFISGARPCEAYFDDGERGCGSLMLRIMREADAIDTLVVLTRWFGGIFLGPERFRLMRNCVTGALSERLRRTTAALGGEAVWGLDLEGMRAKSTVGGYGSGREERQVTGVVGMQIHPPETARSYLLKSFASAGEEVKAQEKKTLRALEREKEQNLGLLLGALRLLYDSWADHLTAGELDKRAWNWYVAVRPAVKSGPAGWGAKAPLRLRDILDLRRPDQKCDN